MANLISAGLLMCRWKNETLEFFLVHPGGPFFKNKNEGVWSIPKGIPDEGEELLDTAIREFKEETGLSSKEPYHFLGATQQKGGKIVHAWAFVGEWNEGEGIKSNYFDLEWPPKSGKFQKFPEQDRAAWMSFDDATIAINPAQVKFLTEATKILSKK